MFTDRLFINKMFGQIQPAFKLETDFVLVKDLNWLDIG